jgi:hypothetical protein
MLVTAPGRALVYLRRIAESLERAHPPTPTLARRPAEFSVATPEDFERGFDDRGRADGASR